MSEQGAKPEVLPGDLITGPGLYEARCGDIVRITGCRDGWWVSIWNGVRTYYSSDGRQRYDEGQEPNQWQLLHWVGPLPASEPESETTTEQLVEIEGQARIVTPDDVAAQQLVRGLVLQVAAAIEPQPEPVPEPQAANTAATEYTPPDGWRLLAVGELVMLDDQWVRQDGSVWRSMGTEGPVSEGARYIRRIEPEPVWVCEGRWRTRRGDIRNVTPTPEGDRRKELYPWWDAQWLLTWTANGRYYSDREDSPLDLVEYLGPIEEQPQPQPIQVREGRWRTRAGEIVSVSAMPTDDDNFSDAYPWWDGDLATWANNGVFFSAHTADKDLVEYLGPIEQPEPQPQPEPQTDAELRIKLLKHANDTQAKTIGQLMTEARDLNMEIGGLQRRLSERDARIRDLETMHAAAMKSFEDANKANGALRLQVQNRQQEYERQKGRIELLETLNAGNNAVIGDYMAKVEKLQGLVDTARQQLEAAATERDELRAAIDAADKQLDQKDAQIRDLRIELDAAQQVPQPVGDEERERIWDEATEAAGRQVIGWLTPLTGALIKQPDERFCRFMAMTLSILPDILPELLGYAVEDESLDSDEDRE